MIPVWYSTGPSPGNLGDVITPFILTALGVPNRHAPISHARLIATGSIVRFATPDMFVWGSGAMRQEDKPSPKARYLAVRGPLTRDVVKRAGGECPEVYGDPALLLPELHNGTVEKVHDLGVVPHYIDSVGARDAWRLKLPVISPLCAQPLVVVDQIRQCRAIVSSSLHGIIVAHAYGIPAAWIRCTDGEFRGRKRTLSGDGTKFRDYAASVGIELVPYPDIASAVPVLPEPFDTAPLRKALGGVR